MKILVRYHDGAVPLTILTQGDWIDLCAAETVTMHAGEFRIISLGVSMQLPEGYEAHIVPRSSTFRKWGILQANSMGVIDESYCGDGDVWGFPALAMRDTTIARGDRICQFRVMRKMDKPELVTVESHDEEEKTPDDAAQGDTPDDFPTAADTPDGGAAVRPQRRAERG